MVLLSVLAPLAVLGSAMPRWIALPLAVFGTAAALHMAWRERVVPVLDVVVGTDGVTSIGGTPVEAFRVDWRGPLAFVVWRAADGRPHRRSLWPDTLSSAARRELRLAVSERGDGQVPPSMAP